MDKYFSELYAALSAEQIEDYHRAVFMNADIGDGSIVGSGSVVVKTIPPYSVAVGVPAKVIRKRGGSYKK